LNKSWYSHYQIAIVGLAITDITFGNSAGAIASCTVAPTLPAGLSIDSATCTISGTPTKMRILGAGIMPPEFESPHVVIEPSILMAAKACQVE
jgi:hypothetical protein